MSSRQLILGTAGHIDHGKTALVRALTGIDADRLPEEKARGMTIDIGFAQLELGDMQLGIIDVPGHERFVKNMLAGAATIDMALLVVAADDAVMPQTREHLAILELLGVEHAVVAMNKTDLRDGEWCELVIEEIRTLVADTRLAVAPIVPTAVPPHGEPQGIELLRETLSQVAAAVPDATANQPFRMCVDRSFSVAGRGTVVTGTVCSGQIGVGDAVEWLPCGQELAVRGLQSHGADESQVARGQRAAINLAGVRHDEINRGDVLATPGYVKPSRWLTVGVSVLADSPFPLKHRGRYSLHIGTQAVPAELHLYGTAELVPGEHGLGQLRCQDPVASVWGQPLVLRMESPLATLGGGHVWQPAATPIRRRQAELVARLGDLASDDKNVRAAAVGYYYSFAGWTPLDLQRDAALDESSADRVMEDFEADGTFVSLPLAPGRPLWLHAERLAEAERHMLELVERYHMEHPLRIAMPRAELFGHLPKRFSRELADALVARLIERGEIEGDKRQLTRAGFAPQLGESQEALLRRVVESIQAAQFTPPALGELASELGASEDEVGSLTSLAVERGLLVPIAAGIVLAADVEAEVRRRLVEALAGGGMTVSQIRDTLETSRKFAVPICEYLDRIGFTRRDGDLRRLV